MCSPQLGKKTCNSPGRGASRIGDLPIKQQLRRPVPKHDCPFAAMLPMLSSALRLSSRHPKLPCSCLVTAANQRFIYIYIYPHRCTYIYTYIYIYVYTYIYIYITDAYIHSSTHFFVCVCVYRFQSRQRHQTCRGSTFSVWSSCQVLKPHHQHHHFHHRPNPHNLRKVPCDFKTWFGQFTMPFLDCSLHVARSVCHPRTCIRNC